MDYFFPIIELISNHIAFSLSKKKKIHIFASFHIMQWRKLNKIWLYVRQIVINNENNHFKNLHMPGSKPGI